MLNRINSYLIKLALLTILLLTAQQSISATTPEQIEELIKQGQLNEALTLTNSSLNEDKGNVNYLFLKGLILTKQNQLDAARDIFIKLTKDHPELPEPFNNLAVIYAEQGDFNNAREALQMAINTHPSYATAHENLGDIYAKMASRAYNQALELDQDNASAREKLLLVGDLFSLHGRDQEPVSPVSTKDADHIASELAKVEQQLSDARSQTQAEANKANQLKQEVISLQAQRSQAEQEAKAAAAQTQAAKAELTRFQQQASQARQQAQVEQQQARTELAAQEQRAKDMQVAMDRQAAAADEQLNQSKLKIQQMQTDLSQLERQRTALAGQAENRVKAQLQENRQAVAQPNTAAVAQPARPATANRPREQDLVTTVQLWAERWSARDVEGYVAAYAEEFRPADGTSRSSWAAQRQERIRKSHSIRVELADIKVRFLNDQVAQVMFRQNYQSDSYKDNIDKTLLLHWQNGRWLIAEESSGR